MYSRIDAGKLPYHTAAIKTGGRTFSNAIHITASMFINENKPDLHAAFERWLEKPYSQYTYNGAENNGNTHLKRTIMDHEVVRAVTRGRRDFPATGTLHKIPAAVVR